MASDGWSTLFHAAFRDSRNAMVLADEDRLVVEINGACLRLLGRSRSEVVGQPMWEFVVGGPAMTAHEWAAGLARQRFSGEADMVRGDGELVHVQWGATSEQATGRRLVLVVALSVSGRGRGVRGIARSQRSGGTLSEREREIVRLVAMGGTGPEIADELHISHNTVRTHLRNSMQRTGARSRAHLVAMALGEGIALTN